MVARELRDPRDRFAIYNGDSIEVMDQLPAECVHLSIYSPPFGGLYQYSSDPKDLSNNDDYEAFFQHYDFVIEGLTRITKPGCTTAVHCTDIPTGNSGNDFLIDFSGDIIRHHEAQGWRFKARYHVWKEPLEVRRRTLIKGLAHKTIVDDSSRCSVANADYLLIFKKPGERATPISHPTGFHYYAGSDEIPDNIRHLRGMKGDQKLNRYSHFIWRRYADAFWDDIRLNRVLPFRDAKDEDDEKHVHPLQLDVIQRLLQLWSNPGETVFTPFMGVGSEVWESVRSDRKAIGVELKPSYFEQAVRNMRTVDDEEPQAQEALFDDEGEE